MMGKLSKQLFLTALLSVLLPLFSGARDLPAFRTDPRINRGTLPDGIVYYLVSNNDTKSCADFTLVQKNYADTAAARARLTRLGNFRDVSPYRFLTGKGIGYSRSGYVTYRDGSTIFSFRNVPTFDASASDSTLLVLFDIIRESSCPQAIIVSGDIDASRLADRMHVLSMTIPPLPEAPVPAGYEWNPAAGPVCRVFPSGSAETARIKVVISSPRVPAELMNTPQPVVAGMFACELDAILSERIRKAFRGAGIPLGDIDIFHNDSSVKEGDETFTVSLTTAPDAFEDALGALSSVLGGMDDGGAGLEEYRIVRNALISEAVRQDLAVNNVRYTEKCIESYLYGASLASPAEERDFIVGKRLPAERELELFNNFAAALLDPSKGVALECFLPGGKADPGNVRKIFLESWASYSDFPPEEITFHPADTSVLKGSRSGSRVRLKSNSDDPITGGRLLTFSNGMKVIFKKTDARGSFDYGLMVKGGYPNISGLKAGEAGFVKDMFDLRGIAGIPADDFRDMLVSKGITMEAAVSVSDIRVTGSAPSSGLPLLLNVLAALCDGQEADEGDLSYFKACRAVRSASEDMDLKSELADMYSPGYVCADKSVTDSLQSSLPARAEKYFRSQFSRMNDGVLVISGDLDEASLQKTLTKELGAFVCGKASAARSRVKRETRDWWFTKAVSGERAVAVSIIVDKPFSMEGYAAFRLASIVLQREVVKALAECGMYAEFHPEVEFFPSESYTMNIECRPCDAAGLPSSVSFPGSRTALNAVRSAIIRVSSSKVSPEELKACKAQLKSGMSSYYSKTSSRIDAAMTRYSVGRDIVTMYAAGVDSVSQDAVMSFLSAFGEGARMEISVSR